MSIPLEGSTSLTGYGPTSYDRTSPAMAAVALAPDSGYPHSLAVQPTEAPQRGLCGPPVGFVRVDGPLDEAVRNVPRRPVNLYQLRTIHATRQT
jgi:ADP-ribose pyrophosphatase YjhB (NUDIX family)